MRKFKVIINGPRQSDPRSVFYLTRARLKGFGYNHSKLYVDYQGIDQIIRESGNFQEIVSECGLPSFVIMDYTPSEIYEMTIKGNFSIEDYLYDYANDEELNDLLAPIYSTFNKMLNTFIRELIEDTQKTEVDVEEEDGCYITLEIRSPNDEISKNVIEYCIKGLKLVTLKGSKIH